MPKVPDLVIGGGSDLEGFDGDRDPCVVQPDLPPVDRPKCTLPQLAIQHHVLPRNLHHYNAKMISSHANTASYTNEYTRNIGNEPKKIDIKMIETMLTDSTIVKMREKRIKRMERKTEKTKKRKEKKEKKVQKELQKKMKRTEEKQKEEQINEQEQE